MSDDGKREHKDLMDRPAGLQASNRGFPLLALSSVTFGSGTKRKQASEESQPTTKHYAAGGVSGPSANVTIA